MSVRLLCLLALGHCSAFVDRNLPPVAAPLLKASFHLSDAQLGWLDGPAFTLLYVVGMLASWPLANSRYRFRLLSGCVVVWSFGMFAFALGASFGMLVAARALVGLGQAAYVPLALSLIMQGSPLRWRGRSVAVFTAASVVGRALALLGGGVVLALLARWAPASGFAHWRLLFLIMAAPNVVLVVMLLRCQEQPAALALPRAAAGQVWAWCRKRPGLICLYLCGAAASVLIVQTVAAWAPSVLQREQGLTPAAAALLFGVALVIASPLGHLTAGVLIDQHGRKVAPMAVVAGALLLAAPPLWVLPSTTSPAAACLVLALVSMLAGTAAVAALVALPRMLPPPLHDAGLRFFLVFVTLTGVGLGPVAAGWISDGLGAGGHALSSALCLVCAAAAAMGSAAAMMARRPWRDVALEILA